MGGALVWKGGLFCDCDPYVRYGLAVDGISSRERIYSRDVI